MILESCLSRLWKTVQTTDATNSSWRPIEWVAVDITEMLMILRGNQYVVVFMEYVRVYRQREP